ncbi:hypothetical protein TPHA_0B01050 [Tetrapisispora phaffii CBS 4417]|uniref:BAH domain-containing protein n=1 Tax=Tetrapisispora phaffii (strain ATCC 24235 / CBS 4417 / NBRC 1672 / NRRL Y-8282 / UCD 70-5) TaxID=1071381 RepID=G8BQI0_TETPH|nr:hypothetical protein TPHA_0B01050 [Tetrapisispora phaffii CBS 4417]CCE61777.1 hypothetical protein TPHA_0B01050 [Tetrapisispora phaffii CBS 4417]
MSRRSGENRAPQSDDGDNQLLHKRIRHFYDQLYTVKEQNGIEIYPVFITLPTKKDYPDYYALITKPVSINTLKKRVPHYTDPQNFINDLAQMIWNAKAFNDEGSEIFKYAQVLEKYVRGTVFEKMKEYYPEISYPNLGLLPHELEAKGLTVKDVIKKEKKIKDDAKEPNTQQKINATKLSTNNISQTKTSHKSSSNIPNLQRKPIYTNSVNTSNKINTAESSPTPRYSQSASPRPQKQIKKHIKRGRPPVIDLPYVQRMKNVVKYLRRELDGNRRPLTAPFERIPTDNNDNTADYLSIISNPMTLEDIFKKIKTRKYKDFQGFQNDINLMIANYRQYYRSNPQLIQLANLLEKQYTIFARHELSKPDTDFMPEGELRYPIDEVIVNGMKYRIGDWALINNPNDVTKPTVGQIFKLWKTSDGQQWLNACWYIRPEQTVHRVDRLFYKNEVFKTGQYRDHLASELVGKGYVVHFTRYQRGDPDVKLEGPLFVCEFRYNENDNAFNKIRTWKACLPEEIRDQDEITIPVNGRKFFKYESPIKHLLPPNATINDPPPEPTHGVPNNPPIVGGVFIGPKLKRDDLGEYASSDDCPRYIIRPNEPTGEGKIDYETGTLTTTAITATGLPRTVHPPPRLAAMKQNELNGHSGSGTPISVSAGQSFYPTGFGHGSSLDNKSYSPLPYPLPFDSNHNAKNNNITVQGLKQRQAFRMQQQQEQNQLNKKSEASSYNLTTIVNNLTSRASKINLGKIVVDTPNAYVLPLTISKKIEVLQRSDFGNQCRLLGKDEALKKQPKGDILWFKGVSVSVEERMLNSGYRNINSNLNECFESDFKTQQRRKKQKLNYEEIEEKLEEEPESNEDNNIQNTDTSNVSNEVSLPKTEPESEESEEDIPLINDIYSKAYYLPGSFALGLKPSANFMAFKLNKNLSSAQD